MKPYLICEKYYPDDLQDEVNRQIENGYEPIGGVSVSVASNQAARYCQAMVLNRYFVPVKS